MKTLILIFAFCGIALGGWTPVLAVKAPVAKVSPSPAAAVVSKPSSTAAPSVAPSPSPSPQKSWWKKIVG